jgi:AcrR family transcriptional regulator
VKAVSHRAGLTTEIVVDTAMKIADKEGLERLTLYRIAEELGVKPPSLYEHVKGTDDLIKLLRLKGLKLMAQKLQHAVIGVSGDDAIKAFADSFRLFIKKHPAVYSLTVKSDVADSKDVTSAAEEIIDTIYAVLKIYGIKEDKLVHATRYLRSVLHGFVSLEMSGGFGIKISPDKSFEMVKEIIISNMNYWV